MDYRNWIFFRRFFNRSDSGNRKVLKPTIFELYEKRIEDLNKIIEIQKSENKILRQERKRLLDKWFEPIQYDSEPVGDEVGNIDYTPEDLYELQAGTVVEGES